MGSTTDYSDALVSAVANNQIEILEKLPLTLADLEKINAQDQSILKQAYLLGHQTILNYFYQIAERTYGTDSLDKIDNKGRTLMHWAVKCNLDKDEFKKLQNKGYDINSHNKPFYVTPLYIAAQESKTAVIESLLQLGADPNIPAINGGTALHVACEFCTLEAVAALLQAKADPNAYFDHAGTPLCIAAQLGREDVIRKLLEVNADRDITTKAGKTPFAIAKAFQHDLLAELLEIKPATIN